MKLASNADKFRVVSILSIAFAENKSVLNLVGNRRVGKDKSIRALMAYAFEECMEFGRVYLTEDGKACALVGKVLLQELLEDSRSLGRHLLLETSTERSRSFYLANGLHEYAQLDVGYPLYCFRK
jgi:hypothetical protein